MVRLSALLLVAACTSSVRAPAAPSPAPEPTTSGAPPDPSEVPPPDEGADEEPDPEDDELADGNADDGSNPEETADDLPAPPPPPVTPAAALPKEEIRRVVARHRKDFARCYEAQVVKQPDLAGRVETTFVVGPDGAVISARATGLHPAVETCLIAALRTMRFPRPTGGGKVTVNYPFNFATAGGTP